MKLTFKGVKINYTVSGEGSALVLLHGFLEDSSMWQPFLDDLSKKNKVICIDLLGHGKTDCLGYVHTMNDHAELVHFILTSLKLRKYTIIGHSMGGYVALALAKLYPEKIKGLCLLNSTFKPDTLERKQLRARANAMAKTNFENLVKMSFANLFSATSKKQFSKEYNHALSIALKTSIQGYIAANEGMMLRDDFTHFFTSAPFKKWMLLGEKDSLIDHTIHLEHTNKHDISLHLLSEGHMSHIENKDDLLKKLLLFTK